MPSKSLDLTKKLFHEKSFQIALVGAVLFLLIAHPILINLVDKGFTLIGIQLNDTLLIVIHSLVYAIALYYSVMVILTLE
tara:strand:- start:46 stop:285 length:240 start_codon:yes stop_codon:yes gene_type:complete